VRERLFPIVVRMALQGRFWRGNTPRPLSVRPQ
jgi:hypothetical protein